MSIQIRKQGSLSRLADILMLPIMYLLQFPSLESPQRTHAWNNTRYSVDDINHLDASRFISFAGDQAATKRWLYSLPVFHMPIFGGWKEYVVLQPKVQQDEWYIGWIPGDVIGVSNVPLTGPVRLLRGPQTVYFFGLNEHSEQIDLEILGEGKIREESEFSHIPLL